MGFPEIVKEDRRLAILQLLKEDADYQVNENVLRLALAGIGHAIGAAALNADLAWLAETGLISTGQIGALTLAKLKQRGLDVANGVSHVPGVARPLPE